MPIKAQKQESNYDIVPAGNHVARVYRVIHIGTISEMYMGEEKMNNKVMLGFELLNEKKVFSKEKGEEPYVISREYTLSMNEKSNLRKLIESMFGVNFREDEAEAFDATSLIGEACLLNVIHKLAASGNTYALIQGASPIPRGMSVDKAYNAPQVLDYENWNEKLFQSLPAFIKEKIESSLEYRTMRSKGMKPLYPTEPKPEDIPF